jgi:hypothetical protein
MTPATRWPKLIDAEFKVLEGEMAGLLREVVE